MEYATRADLVSRYTESEISSLESVGRDTPDVVVSTEALSDAQEELNSLIAVRYKLPLPSVPSPLKSATCEVARFKMYKDRATEEVKYRYEKAIKWATLVSQGDARLVFNADNTSPEQVAAVSDPLNPMAAAFTGAVFSDSQLDKMVSFDRVSSGLGLGGWGRA